MTMTQHVRRWRARVVTVGTVALVVGAMAPGFATAASPFAEECPPGTELAMTDTGIAECVPVTTTAPPVPQYRGATFTDSRPKVVTLGDSYSSGTGIWREDSSYDQQFGGYENELLYLTARSDLECWRELQDTPGPRHAAAVGAKAIFLACKGAELGNVAHQVTVLQGQWPFDAAAGWSGAKFVLTAGGNDLRTNRGETWPELLERCIMEANPFGGCHTNSKNQIKNFDAIETNLGGLYRRLAAIAPGATIRVLGYPYIMRPRASGLSQCPHVTGITGNEARWIDQQVDRLNERIIKAVASTKSLHPVVDIEYVEVRPLMTVGACFGQSADAHINDRVTAWSGQGLLLTSDASFHPTRRGYDVYHDAFLASL